MFEGYEVLGIRPDGREEPEGAFVRWTDALDRAAMLVASGRYQCAVVRQARDGAYVYRYERTPEGAIVGRY